MSTHRAHGPDGESAGRRWRHFGGHLVRAPKDGKGPGPTRLSRYSTRLQAAQPFRLRQTLLQLYQGSCDPPRFRHALFYDTTIHITASSESHSSSAKPLSHNTQSAALLLEAKAAIGKPQVKVPCVGVVFHTISRHLHGRVICATNYAEYSFNSYRASKCNSRIRDKSCLHMCRLNSSWEAGRVSNFYRFRSLLSSKPLQVTTEAQNDWPGGSRWRLAATLWDLRI